MGNQASGPPNGQLVVWFPPFDVPDPRYCKLDVAIGTAGGIAVDSQDRVYVASARGTAGVLRYTGPFPTSDDAAGGCGRVDATGAPLADSVTREVFLPADGTHLVTPNAVVIGPRGTFYVSSILNGVVAEYDAEGRFLRRVVEPVPGESLPFPSTGTPFGLGVDSGGTLYFADLGLVVGPRGPGPGPGQGSVRRVRFDAEGNPLPPETLDRGLNFPDGIGIWEP
ncbi:MAG: hypothetical protein KatS3mg076_0212 [Candidatus Binatia bacterium]|nr:MAG: hypothetical protein KatS3mg076_0212 [Candidatus Binatia bacterium]